MTRQRIGLAVVAFGIGFILYAHPWRTSRAEPQVDRVAGDVSTRAATRPAAVRSHRPSPPVVRAATALASLVQPEPEGRRSLPESMPRGRTLAGQPEAVPWPGPWPKNLDEARKVGVNMEGYSVDDVTFSDRELRLIASLRTCLSGKIPAGTTGDLLIDQRFSVQDGAATPGAIEPHDSTLPDDVDGVVLDCVQRFHSSDPLTLSSAGPDFHKFNIITLPLDDNRIYRALMGKR